MTSIGDQPTGLRGPVACFSALVPSGGRVLHMPGRNSAEKHDAVVVEVLTESMGPVERALQEIAARLADGGALVLDVENSQSLRRLRMVVEGRPGSFDPVDSFEDPAQALPLRRLLQASAGAGLCVDDVVRVPAAAPELGAGFARAMIAQGLLPLDWLGGPPPARFWLVARRRAPRAGSVIVGAGDPAAQAATAACVRAFLPADWEVVLAAAAEGDGCEADAYDRALADARGELVWFLRAGATASRALFVELSTFAAIAPAAPGAGGARARPGDVSGLMLARNDALLAGPFGGAAGGARNTQVALEDWHMRLEAQAAKVQLCAGGFASPPPPAESPATFAAEAQALLERWAPLAPGNVRRASGPAPAAPWSGREPKVTLCMIARDEERFLGECLARARAAVDEIVLVDTGSTDRTVAIAEAHGARVLREPWADDFSAPRNTALRAATGDWILVLDADEMLTDGAALRLRELVRDPGVAGYHLHFTNRYTGGKTVGVLMVRLFRNLPGLRWQNVIHEQVTPSLVAAGDAAGLPLSIADVEVEHLGYLDEVMDGRQKNARNERLFRKQLAQHPDDIYALYKYGDFLRRVPGRGAEARELLERCLLLILAGPPSLPRELPYAGEVAALCALEHARSGGGARAREIVEQALRRLLPTPNLHYIAASLLLEDGRNDAAIAHFRRCLAYRGQVLVVPIQDGITGHVSLAGIAQGLLQKGDAGRAQRLVERAIALQPAYEPSHLLLSRLFLQRGDAGRALAVLTGFLAAHPDAPGACQQTTLILHRLGHRQQARRMGARAVALLRAGAADHEAARMEQYLAAL
jgi:tetratricopeptide (TPR) repeat protein